MNENRLPPGNLPVGKSQPAHRTSDRVYAKRVPSALTPDRQRDAVRQVRAGRSVHQVAAEFSVSETVIFELWKRDTDRKTKELLESVNAKLEEVDEVLRGSRARQLAHRSAAA